MKQLDGRGYHADVRCCIVAGVNGALALRDLARARPRDANRVFRQVVG